MFARRLEFLKEKEVRKRWKFPPRGWAIGRKNDGGGPTLKSNINDSELMTGTPVTRAP